ncbi:hypothetical protein [Gimesia panareensis]|uniref:hypothetical protein n=1 Tax=Gimesia panareensis TaxID=2527978 RepID=UPI0011A9AB3A|nr:hypothetical protein [Gimesia panareensis]
MTINQVIDQTDKIIQLLEQGGHSGAWSKSLRHYASVLSKDPQSNEALEYLYSACTQPRGLLDVWVEGLTLDDWGEILTNLKTAIENSRRQNRST